MTRKQAAVKRLAGRDVRLLITVRRRTISALLCLALSIWAVIPAFSHTPDVFETIQDHMEMIAEHGHSHGLAEDLYWALHGHGHDAADHDHSQAIPILGHNAKDLTVFSDAWPLGPPSARPGRIFRIERPPRA
tara:strand:+ start:433 stop:831 length:399 start_codon:yes stop_codon:yes gene_type:complete